MYSIAYVVPYFGKFPKGFQFWLLSCKCNPSIDWLIFTDDKTPYDYPENVKVTYWTFDQMKKKVQAIYDFPIFLERPYKLCDFKPAYGEIFADELKDYDFWGHCDIDLVWGNIRKFYTDEVLGQYEKVGFNGHSNLYKNTPEVCARYRTHRLVNHSAKYFMPVYVLHTIVAAGVRTVLLKIGISSGVLHFMIGFGVSVFVPAVIYMIAEKQWWLLFWFEPIKAMKLRNQKKIKGGR